MQPTRINKFLGTAGVCSRRQADALIKAGRVTLNGKPAQLGSKVSPGDTVKVDGKAIQTPSNTAKTYL